MFQRKVVIVGLISAVGTTCVMAAGGRLGVGAVPACAVAPLAAAEDQIVRIKVAYMPGQESRVSDNFVLEAGDGSEVEWRVELPEQFRGRFAFALNRDRQGRFGKSDLNLADHLTHGSRTSGHYGEYRERVYIARAKYVDENGVHHDLTRQLAAEHPEVAGVLKDGFYVAAYRVNPSHAISCYGGSGGSPEERALPDGWSWSSFVVRAGKRIDAITANYAAKGGASHSVKFGGGGGDENAPFTLNAGEHVVKIRGRSGNRLDAIQFVTNTGRESPKYGGGGGKPFEVSAPEGHEIAGFRTRTGDEVDRICPVFRPIAK